MSLEASIDLLPNELLSKVFLATRDLACAEYHGRHIPNTPVICHVITSLRLVCGRWDALIISTPELWSVISFLPPCSRYDSSSGLRPIPLFVLKRWIERSAEHPLYVNLEMPMVEHWNRNTPRALDAIFDTAGRWRYMRMVLFSDPVGQGLSRRDSPCPSTDLLEELCVDFQHIRGAEGVLKYFKRSPRLRTLNFHFYIKTFQPRTLEMARSCLPLSQITRLNFACLGVPLGSILAFSSACPSLTWLTFDTNREWTSGRPGRSPLSYSKLDSRYSFPQLKVFAVSMHKHGDVYAPYFADTILCLDCPKLELFSVKGVSPILELVALSIKFVEKCCSSPPHTVRIVNTSESLDYTPTIPPLSDFKASVLDNCTLALVPRFELAIPIPKKRYMSAEEKEELEQLRGVIDEHVQQNPSVRFRMTKTDWWVWWGRLSTAPQSVHTYFDADSIRFLSATLE